jgi:putative peptide zinc metalloprotease protein
VWLTKQALLRAGADSFLREFVVEPGTRVSKGTALIQCENPVLDAQLKASQTRVAELEAVVVSRAVKRH